jgi:hypothetical protein
MGCRFLQTRTNCHFFPLTFRTRGYAADRADADRAKATVTTVLPAKLFISYSYLQLRLSGEHLQ